MSAECASIGMKRDADVNVARARFEKIIQSVRELVDANPEKFITGEGEFSVIFGDRAHIKEAMQS